MEVNTHRSSIPLSSNPEFHPSPAASIRKVGCMDVHASVHDKPTLPGDNPRGVRRSALDAKPQAQGHLVPLHNSGQHPDRHLLQSAQRAGLYLLHISLISRPALLIYWLGPPRQTKPVPWYPRPRCAVQTPSRVLHHHPDALLCRRPAHHE